MLVNGSNLLALLSIFGQNEIDLAGNHIQIEKVAVFQTAREKRIYTRDFIWSLDLIELLYS